MAGKKKVRVGIIGVGNCASSLVQGVHYYRNAKPADQIPGLMHVDLGGYHIRDIEFTAAFDVVKGKVGKDLSEAVFAYPNNTIKFSEVPKLDVKVHRGMTHDGLGQYVSGVVEKEEGPTDDIIGILKDTKTDVVVSYLPVGSEMATKSTGAPLSTLKALSCHAVARAPEVDMTTRMSGVSIVTLFGDKPSWAVGV